MAYAVQYFLNVWDLLPVGAAVPFSVGWVTRRREGICSPPEDPSGGINFDGVLVRKENSWYNGCEIFPADAEGGLMTGPPAMASDGKIQNIQKTGLYGDITLGSEPEKRKNNEILRDAI